MTLTEFEQEANAYADSVRATCDEFDRQWEQRNQPGAKSNDGPPLFAVPDPKVWDGISDEQRDFIRRAEQDTHLGRFVLIRALQEIGDVAPGELARATSTEAAEAVRLGWATYEPEPVVRPAIEQLDRAVRIKRGGTGNH